jgi:hypothetical protein
VIVDWLAGSSFDAALIENEGKLCTSECSERKMEINLVWRE